MGDRLAHLTDAEAALRDHKDIEIVKLSQIYETQPWGIEDTEHEVKEESGALWFLNQVLEVNTSLSPDELLTATQDIEKTLGRESKGDYAPRTMDIDILLYNEDVLDTDHLHIPHRHLADREFVLVPLVEIAPELKDPQSHNLYKKILENIEDKAKVIPFL